MPRKSATQSIINTEWDFTKLGIGGLDKVGIKEFSVNCSMRRESPMRTTLYEAIFTVMCNAILDLGVLVDFDLLPLL